MSVLLEIHHSHYAVSVDCIPQWSLFISNASIRTPLTEYRSGCDVSLIKTYKPRIVLFFGYTA